MHLSLFSPFLPFTLLHKCICPFSPLFSPFLPFSPLYALYALFSPFKTYTYISALFFPRRPYLRLQKSNDGQRIRI